MIINSTNPTHNAACGAAEMTRQIVIGSARLAYDAGGEEATYTAAVTAAEIAFYRTVIASCTANGLSPNNFVQALRDLGTGGS